MPSEVLTRADTLDVMVMDIAVSWNNHQHQLQEAKRTGKPPPAPEVSIETLKEMLARVRKERR